MNKKQNKGITLVALVVTIVIMLILLSVGIVAYNTINTAGTQDMVNNMLLIQTKVRAINEQVAFNGDKTAFVGIKLKDQPDKATIAGVALTTDELNDDYFYIYDRDTLDSMGLGAIPLKEGQVYIVNYATTDIVFPPGRVNSEGVRVYRLSEVMVGSVYTDKTIAERPGKTIADRFDTGKVKIGDYVNYTPDSAITSYEVLGSRSKSDMGGNQTHNRESLQWRVLDKLPSGELRLISAEPTSFTLILQGANGYNNAVKLIDELCSIYGGSKGTAQGLKIEDIEKHTTYDYTTYTNYGSINTPQYGEMYPRIFAQENKQLGNGVTGHLGLSEQDIWYTGKITTATLNATYTYWSKSMVPEDWENAKYHELFINNGSNYQTYWLASRCVSTNTANARFEVRMVYSGYVISDYLQSSNNGTTMSVFAVRPVVTLNSDVKVIGGDGVNGWEIEAP